MIYKPLSPRPLYLKGTRPERGERLRLPCSKLRRIVRLKNRNIVHYIISCNNNSNQEYNGTKILSLP
jgi:hypothetical protein